MVERSDGCWIWKGSKNKDGYGRFRFNGKAMLAHRVSWVLAYGEPREGSCVLHKCDNPACVRPEHLFLGSRADNHADATRKGRARWAHLRAWRDRLGGERSSHVLTEDQVKEVRLRFAAGETQTALAKTFGVHQTTIHNIVANKTWRKQ